MYSHYKKHPTVKFALVCTPLRAISLVSRAWGGRVSDVELVHKSGFISPLLHHPSDQILADRGFTLQDDFAVICSAELIIPAFTKGKPQLSQADVEGTRDIANIRIHVVRVIGLLKKSVQDSLNELMEPLNLTERVDRATMLNLTERMDRATLLILKLNGWMGPPCSSLTELKTEKPVKRLVKQWECDSTEQLQNCLDTTNWNILYSDDVNECVETVSS